MEEKDISWCFLGLQDMASDIHIHTFMLGLEVSACLCAEMSSQSRPYHCLMIIKKVGCFFPTWRRDNKESAGLSVILFCKTACRPLHPHLPSFSPAALLFFSSVAFCCLRDTSDCVAEEKAGRRQVILCLLTGKECQRVLRGKKSWERKIEPGRNQRQTHATCCQDTKKIYICVQFV